MAAYSKETHLPTPNVVVKQGSIEEWDLFNATIETHSFHIHQMSFVALGERSGPATLDTVLVPFGKLLPNRKQSDYPLVAPSRTRILLDFRHVPRGTFVFHCHMLFHEDRGMMGVIKVV
jgi:FtsP/CotA-like multicopper oxidase with cupredoxin domain